MNLLDALEPHLEEMKEMFYKPIFDEKTELNHDLNEEDQEKVHSRTTIW